MSLQCPLPENINPLSPNGFMFQIEKAPKVQYFCQVASIPVVSLPPATQESPFSKISLAGEKLEYGELTIQFLVDENMENYKSIYDWLKALGFPENHEEYASFLSDQTRPISETAKNASDGSLTILGSNYRAVKTIKFIDLIPTSLSGLEFSSLNQDVQYLTAQATFVYTYYEFDV